MLTRTATVGDQQGLHAQLVHRLAAAAGRFSASLWVRYAGRRASLAVPIQVLALGAGAGADVTVMADGLDEAEALDAICELISTP
jgi:phosphocarrier protein HPr